MKIFAERVERKIYKYATTLPNIHIHPLTSSSFRISNRTHIIPSHIQLFDAIWPPLIPLIPLFRVRFYVSEIGERRINAHQFMRFFPRTRLNIFFLFAIFILASYVNDE